MPTRAEIIAEARTWKGTQWSHQGRLKKIGVDCVGIVTETGKITGAMDAVTVTGYGREPDPIKMRRALKLHLNPVPKTEMKPGDIPWMRSGRHGQHLGIYTERNTLIHAPIDGQVEETPLDDAWKARIIEVYRYRNLSD
jgi:cell wall-associated NlpC family hydrolase